MVDPELFYRIHKSVIISQHKIKKFVKSFTGKYSVKMNDKRHSTFEIGRTYLTDIRNKMKF